MTPFEIGTDLSGSLRIPAHFCGLFGLKPSEHRVSLDGLIPGLPSPRSVRLMSCIGPMARSADDLALLYSIIAGPDARDTDVPPVPPGTPPVIDLKQLRIAVAPTFAGFPVAVDIRQAIEALAQQIRSAGATVEEARLPELDFAQDLASAGALIGMMVGAFQPGEHEQPTTLAQYLEALHRRDQSMLAWERFFETWDALLCPPAMVGAFPHCETGAPLQVDGQATDYWYVSAHCTVFNYTGHPAAVLPHTRDGNGLPIGIQLVAKRWDDARLLGIVQALAPIGGEWARPAGY
jgi:amidase